MVRYLICFGYIGTYYKGLQKLPSYPGQTVQDVLEIALGYLNPRNEPKSITCSRTDKGTHAVMNALHVDLEHKVPGETYQPNFVTDRVNEFLKNSKQKIIVTKTCVVPDTFHVRRHARWRSYIYRLALLKPHIMSFSYRSNGYEKFLPLCEKERCHIVHGSLDPLRINEATKYFVGTHDFRTFTKCLKKENRDPVRTVHELVYRPSQAVPDVLFDPMHNNIEMWEIFIRADSYLYHQVRKIVGVLLAVGYGFLSLEEVQDMIDHPGTHKWRKSLLPPAEGLYLTDIHFPKEAGELSAHVTIYLGRKLRYFGIKANSKIFIANNALLAKLSKTTGEKLNCQLSPKRFAFLWSEEQGGEEGEEDGDDDEDGEDESDHEEKTAESTSVQSQ